MSSDHVIGKIELSGTTAKTTHLSEGDFKVTANQGTGIPIPNEVAVRIYTCAETGGHNYQAVVTESYTINASTANGRDGKATTNNTYTLFCTRCGDSKPMK